ncbi:OPT oligopeptide transporter [Lanmaoa asiatica]|nr:OPT oligopeptide transporter [Lanmaoa asiatica]
MATTADDGRISTEDYEKTDLEGDVFANIVDFDDPNIDRENAVAGMQEDDSPYPEVRSAVANTDDPSIPASTIRTWVIGLTWAVILSGLNQFFFFRFPSVSVSGFVAVLISLPMGRAWAAVVPNWRIFGVPLNPGPFSIKEHVLLTIMSTVGGGSAYATDIVAVQRVYYNQTYNFSYQWMLVMSTQLLGFSIGGILRRFLVQPPSMIWPVNLVTCALFNTLHSKSYVGMGTRGGISRERFFLYAWIAGVCWYFVPGYLFQALSYFSWVCWIAPNNIVVNQLFGYVNGLGMSLVTFDWAQISYIGELVIKWNCPLATPWWAEANIFVGFVFFFWFLVPILYYTNTWYSEYLPMSTRVSYDNTGSTYNVAQIINADASLNLTAYGQYSPLFLSMTFALSYGLSFASITATLTHAFLYFRKQIWVQSRRSMDEQPDIHARLMSKYKQVPEWWYGIIFGASVSSPNSLDMSNPYLIVSMFVFGIILIEVWHTDFPVWAFCLALVIAFFYVIPIGMIQAITNQQVGLNVITELIIGYALPGRPIAMMMFKTWGYITMTQALSFASDFKLGHYMKIPPRLMFWSQVIATIVAGTVQLGVQSWMFTNIPDMCSAKQKDGFICPSTEVFGTASIIWGVIGPQRVFSSGQIYNTLTYFFLIGVLCPLIAYLIQRKWPKSIIRYINFPVIFSGTGNIPPANAVNYVSWAIVGFIFQYHIRRKHFLWWTKYNYILSAAMDSGVAVGVILIFFVLQYPKNGAIGSTTVQTWWGNTVFLNTADGKGLPYKSVPASGTFGISTGYEPCLCFNKAVVNSPENLRKMPYEVELDDDMKIRVTSLNGHDWSKYCTKIISAAWEAQRATMETDYAIVLAIIKSNQVPSSNEPYKRQCLTRWQIKMAKRLQIDVEKGEKPCGRVNEDAATARGPSTATTAKTTGGMSVITPASSPEAKMATQQVNDKTANVANLHATCAGPTRPVDKPYDERKTGTSA